jgi:hypothetical protein
MHTGSNQVVFSYSLFMELFLRSRGSKVVRSENYTSPVYFSESTCALTKMYWIVVQFCVESTTSTFGKVLYLFGITADVGPPHLVYFSRRLYKYL